MAKRKSTTSAPKSNTPKGKKWSELKPGTQKKYKAAGVTPAKYNSWRNPKTRANAKKKGQTREQFLGLRPNQISGASKESLKATALKNITRVFGERPRFNPKHVREWLDKIGARHTAKIARGDDDQVYQWAFNPDEEFDDEEASTPKHESHGGYLFYH